MAANRASSRPRLIRELVCPDIEEPLKQREIAQERRRSLRYARNLPGTLIVGEAEHPVTCKDIGYGGVRVVAPGTVKVPLGKRVEVRVELGERSFQDEFSVRRCAGTTDGTTLNLAQ